MSRRVNYTVYNHGRAYNPTGAGMPRLNHDLYKMHLYFAKVSVSIKLRNYDGRGFFKGNVFKFNKFMA